MLWHLRLSSDLIVRVDTLHGVGFAWGGLPVGEDGTIVAFEYLVEDWSGSHVVDILLRALGIKDVTELEGRFLLAR